jgi:voltage-gated potassium channel
MFAAIGILWSVLAMITSKLVESKIKKDKNTTVVDETKSAIKDKIDDIEKLSKKELSDLVRMIRALNYNDSNDS